MQDFMEYYINHSVFVEQEYFIPKNNWKRENIKQKKKRGKHIG